MSVTRTCCPATSVSPVPCAGSRMSHPITFSQETGRCHPDVTMSPPAASWAQSVSPQLVALLGTFHKSRSRLAVPELGPVSGIGVGDIGGVPVGPPGHKDTLGIVTMESPGAHFFRKTRIRHGRSDVAGGRWGGRGHRGAVGDGGGGSHRVRNWERELGMGGENWDGGWELGTGNGNWEWGVGMAGGNWECELGMRGNGNWGWVWELGRRTGNWGCEMEIRDWNWEWGLGAGNGR